MSHLAAKPLPNTTASTPGGSLVLAAALLAMVIAPAGGGPRSVNLSLLSLDEPVSTRRLTPTVSREFQRKDSPQPAPSLQSNALVRNSLWCYLVSESNRTDLFTVLSVWSHRDYAQAMAFCSFKGAVELNRKQLGRGAYGTELPLPWRMIAHTHPLPLPAREIPTSRA